MIYTRESLPASIQHLLAKRAYTRASFELLRLYREHPSESLATILTDTAYMAIWACYVAGMYDWMRLFARTVVDLGTSSLPLLTLAKAYNGLAIACHHLGETDLQYNYQARDLFEQAWNQTKTRNERKKIAESKVKNDFGIVIRLGFQGKKHDAIALIQSVLAFCLEQELPLETGQAYKIYGELLFYFQDYEDAFQQFGHAIHVFQSRKTKPFRNQLGSTLLLMAEDSLKRSTIDEARFYLDKALPYLDSSRNYLAPYLTARILEEEAQPDREDAIRSYLDQARDLLEKERWAIRSETALSGFLSRNQREDVYLRSIAYHLNANNAEQALIILEQFRGKIFMDRFTQQEWKDLGGIPVELQHRRIQLLEAYQKEYSKTTQREDHLQTLTEEIYRIEEEITAVKPVYEWFTPQEITIQSFQQLLRSDQCVIVFFYYQHRLTLFILTKTTLQTITRNVSSEFLQTHADAYKQSIHIVPPTLKTAQISTFHRSALDRELIQPMLPYLAQSTQILLVPFGALHHIPLHSWIADEQESSTHIKSITYLPTLRSLPYMIFHPPSSFKIGLFTDPRTNLPASKEEGRRIAAMNVPHRSFYGNKATRSQLLELLQNYPLVHYSGHIHTNLEKPLFSYLECAPTQSEQMELADDRLYLKEIYQLRSDCFRFISLGGCSSGISKGYRGEEWVGFLRGFFYAGGQGALVSYWDIEDESAALFYTQFYRQIIQGKKPLEEAYWSAYQMLHSTYSHPYYYEPYALYLGYTAPSEVNPMPGEK